MNELSISEIKDWGTFEQLLSAYFREVSNERESNVEFVEVKPTGTGPDGGCDILVTLKVNDSISKFQRIWVVQCKFHDKDVGKSHLADTNIPSLIHEYGANGYLLVVKSGVTSGLSTAFDNLNRNCKFGYRYEFWRKNDILFRIRPHDRLVANFFPKYYSYLERQKMTQEGLL